MVSRFSAASIRKAAPVFAAMGDPTRLGLVARLSSSGPVSISKLSEDVAVTRQAVTKHLRILDDAGLVNHRRQGRESIWQIDPKGLARAKTYLDRIDAQWDAALDRLKNLVEED